MLFLRTGNKSYAEESLRCINELLETLAKGPDGKTQVSVASKACICWGCGKISLPANMTEVEADTTNVVKPICTNCTSDLETNVVYGRQPDGSALPWIEKKIITAPDGTGVPTKL